jgi:hypothetical protein
MRLLNLSQSEVVAKGDALHRAVPFWMGPRRRVSSLAGWILWLSNALRIWPQIDGEIEFLNGGGCSYLARCLSGPAFVCMRERAHLLKTEQPRDFGYA